MPNQSNSELHRPDRYANSEEGHPDVCAIRYEDAFRVDGRHLHTVSEALAVEEPLEIRLVYGRTHERLNKPISVTMRTPGNDFELVAGFLMTEGIVNDSCDIEEIAYDTFDVDRAEDEGSSDLILQRKNNSIRVELAADVRVRQQTLERNFYTTSSCGVCGKASLLALRTVCPPRRPNEFVMDVELLRALPRRMRAMQSVFDSTGGLHGAGLFGDDGRLIGLREDVGRHNAVDKLLGREFLDDKTPIRDAILLLSGRASFELLQKAAMVGVPMVASVGAPSSLAVQLAREFDITLVGFLREDHFNIYHGTDRLAGLVSSDRGSNS